MEALACGVPVVCGSWGGTAELVGESAGVVVPTGQWTYGEGYVEQLSQGVETVLGDLSTFKQQARKHAERALDLKVVAGAYSRFMNLA